MQAAGLGSRGTEHAGHVRGSQEPVGRDRHQQAPRLQNTMDELKVVSDFVGANMFEHIVPINDCRFLRKFVGADVPQVSAEQLRRMPLASAAAIAWSRIVPEISTPAILNP